MRRPLVVLALLLLAFAAAAAKPYLRKPKRGLQMRTSPYTVGPGEDREWCEYRRVPIKKPMDVVGFKVRMPEGAHHFVVWGYGGDEQDDSKFPQGPVESVGCVGLGPGELAPRVIIPLQSPNTRFTLPAGVGLRIEPQQQVWLNPHLRNLGTESITPDVRFNFYAAPPGKVKHYAEGLIVGNMDGIDIPAGGDQTITAEWASPTNLNIVFLATHQHRLGTYANIEVLSPDGAEKKLIYENYRWDHPRSYWPPTPLRIVTGQKLRITCSWHNTDATMVRFGPNVTDEMCFILGFFYRDPGDTAPIDGAGCLPAKSGAFCPFGTVVD